MRLFLSRKKKRLATNSAEMKLESMRERKADRGMKEKNVSKSRIILETVRRRATPRGTGQIMHRAGILVQLWEKDVVVARMLYSDGGVKSLHRTLRKIL